MKIKLAKHRFTGKIMHIDKARNGLSCDCICEKCGERLEACQGSKRDWHFRHHTNINCLGSQESALHKLAKQLILANNEIRISTDRVLFYSDAVEEEALGLFRPDAKIVSNGENVFFEILVTNPVSLIKESFFKTGEHKSIEIDLRNVSPELSYDEIKNLVLERSNNKRIIFWQKVISPPKKEYSLLEVIGIIFLVFFGLKLLFSRNK
jgi:phage antirepressor YoqD-like protein